MSGDILIHEPPDVDLQTAEHSNGRPVIPSFIQEASRDIPWYPQTQEDLPYSDGEPMESHWQVLQIALLTEPLELFWNHREDFFVGARMFVYFSPQQVRTHDFKGPDVFVALGVPRRKNRLSWVTWEEGKPPDVVIELVSSSNAPKDTRDNLPIYQDRLRVPEYYWFNPRNRRFTGYELINGIYQPIPRDRKRGIYSPKIGLRLVRWDGEYRSEEDRWMRWATPDGVLLPTPQEAFGAASERAEEERQRGERERQRADRLAARLRELGIDPEEGL